MNTPASKNPSRRRVLAALAALPALQGLHGVAGAQAQAETMQQNPITAIDIALEPDSTMVQHAKAANARLLRHFPKGFALDATHRTSRCCSSSSARPTSTRSMPPRPTFWQRRSRLDGN
jgi:hypothetical protein